MSIARRQILIVEDEEAHVEAIRRAFEAAGTKADIRAVGTLREYREHIAAYPPAIALIDLNLPDGRAVEVLTNPPEDALFPVLVMTAFGNQQIVAEVMKAGALDYVVKSPEAFAILPHTVRGVLREWKLLQRQKRAEAALANEAVRRRILIEQSRDGIVVLDPYGKVFESNSRFTEMLGYSPNEMRQLSVWDWDAHWTRDQLMGMIRLIDATGNQFETRHRRKDGTEYDVEISSNGAICNGQKLIFCVCRDITERKKAEEDLHKSNRALKVISECNEALVRATTETELLQKICSLLVDHGGYRMAWVGFAEQDAAKSVRPVAQAGFETGYLDTAKITWADTEGGRGPTGIAIRTGRPVLARNILTDPTYGLWRPEAIQRGYASSATLPLIIGERVFGVVMIYAAVPDAFNTEEMSLLADLAGDLAYGITTLRTRAERKRVEEALRENQEHLKESQHVAKLGHYVLDFTSGQWTCSTALDEVFGIDTAYPKTVEGWVNLLHPEHKDEMRDYLLGHVLKDGQPFDKDYRIIRQSDGAICWVHGRGNLEINAAGKPVSMFGTIQDITERKRVEEEVRQLNTDLERRVQERTAELQAANKELESFSYSVSHDLRAPLRAINGFATILSRDYAQQLDEEGQRTLGVVCAEAEKMRRLIDDLLEFSRMGRQAMQREEVDMRAMAQSAFDECAAQAPGRDIRLKLHPLPPAHGDAALLSHIWTNLISNAVKYTRTRPVAEIEITGRMDGDELIYCVKDNGVGFDMRYVHKLFAVFQRLHSEEEFEGTGVGLALVQRIVLRHSGSVWAEATLNKGADFYFTLPAGKV